MISRCCASKRSEALTTRWWSCFAKERDNKLTPAEYEETTWSARSWTTFAAQKISVALHYAAAFEISMALRVPKFDQAELDAAAARRMAGGG